MSEITDFVVASRIELHEAFLTQVPVEMRDSEKFVESSIHPFTGESLPGEVRKVREYIAVGRPFIEAREAPVVPFWKRLPGLRTEPVDSFHHLPHAHMKHVNQMALADLHHAIDGTDSGNALDLIVQVMKPPGQHQESGIEKLDPQFVSALASLQDLQLTELVNCWLLSPEVSLSAEDASQVIVELRRLARTVEDQNKGFFLACSL